MHLTINLVIIPFKSIVDTLKNIHKYTDGHFTNELNGKK